MSQSFLLEAFGYLASILVAVSLMMRSIVRLRWINLAGAACFTVYGILIAAYPVAVLNFAIVLINVWFLLKLRRVTEVFSVVELPVDSPYLAEFLRFHGDEIRRFQPDFAFDPAVAQHVLMVLRDPVPEGVLILRPTGGRAATVALDFVTPAYRDFRIGDYLFRGRRDLFAACGVDRVDSAAGNRDHARYLERIGFTRGADLYTLDVRPA